MGKEIIAEEESDREGEKRMTRKNKMKKKNLYSTVVGHTCPTLFFRIAYLPPRAR